MTAQHSKGPWKHRPICSSEGELIRDEIVNKDGEIIADDVRRPEDAPVIAAAPEMLEELQLQAIALRQEIAATDPRQCTRLTSLQIRLDRLEGVIAKAEGR